MDCSKPLETRKFVRRKFYFIQEIRKKVFSRDFLKKPENFLSKKTKKNSQKLLHSGTFDLLLTPSTFHC